MWKWTPPDPSQGSKVTITGNRIEIEPGSECFHKEPRPGRPILGRGQEISARTGSLNYRDRITIEPATRGGKACIRGLPITVYDVLECLAAGMTEDQILADAPVLTRADIRACLAFAADRERR
jgi:uncharacterized protein (DUF433 family)